ncbi:MAG: ABC transporter permease [Bacteroidales bacterium]|nr:ABC transporter permease [Bacteroidales bacterium]
MNLELFVARRLYHERKGERRISRPAVAVAQWGVAVGTIVMFVSISIIVGFKHNIREKIIGFGGHIQVMSYESVTDAVVPVVATDGLLVELKSLKGVQGVSTYVQKPGMIMVNGEYEGIMLKGVGENFDTSFVESSLVAGELPKFTETTPSNSIVISRLSAQRLQVGVGDKINLYFVENGIKARRMVVAALYETHLAELDNAMALTDIYTVQRLNGWGQDEVSAVEIAIADYGELENIRQEVNGVLYEKDENSAKLYAPTIEELYPSLFAWLSVLDQTVWLILVLVLFIAGFTMVSGLLILILEKSNFIGVMKALGARNVSVAKVFLYYACIVIGRGIIIGNVIAVVMCFVQQRFGIVALDPEMYYMNTVPVEFSWLLLPMNVGMFLLSVLMLVAPSALIAKIEPVKAIKYE